MKKPRYIKAYAAFTILGLALGLLRMLIILPYYQAMDEMIDISSSHGLIVAELVEKAVLIFLTYFAFKWCIDRFAILEHHEATNRK